MVENIEELRFCKDEIFKNDHIYIAASARLYVSESFARYLYGKNLKDNKFSYHHLNQNDHYITYGSFNYKCTLALRNIPWSNGHKLEQYSYYLAGSSGSHGFGGLEHTRREKLGVRTIRRANKYIVEEYKKSPFIRCEKINKLIKKMES